MRIPGHEQDDVTWIEDRFKNVPTGQPRCVRLQAKRSGNLLRFRFLYPFRRTLRIDENDRGRLTNFSFIQPLFAQFTSRWYLGVFCHLPDTEMIVLENLRAPSFLR